MQSDDARSLFAGSCPRGPTGRDRGYLTATREGESASNDATVPFPGTQRRMCRDGCAGLRTPPPGNEKRAPRATFGASRLSESTSLMVWFGLEQASRALAGWRRGRGVETEAGARSAPTGGLDGPHTPRRWRKHWRMSTLVWRSEVAHAVSSSGCCRLHSRLRTFSCPLDGYPTRFCIGCASDCMAGVHDQDSELRLTGYIEKNVPSDWPLSFRFSGPDGVDSECGKHSIHGSVATIGGTVDLCPVARRPGRAIGTTTERPPRTSGDMPCPTPTLWAFFQSSGMHPPGTEYLEVPFGPVASTVGTMTG